MPAQTNTIATLLTQGWEMRHPANPTAAHIDTQCAQRVPCDRCGGQCRYIPLTKPDRYRAFALCLECGHEHEF